MKIKILVVLALAACLFAVPASAATVYVVGLCGTFSNPLPNTTISGSWTCPTSASLGIVQPLVAEFIVYNSDYSNGVTPSVTETTHFTFTTGATLQWTSDILTTTGAANSNPATCSSGATLNPLTTAFGPVVLAGCYDNATAGFGGSVTVNYTNSFPLGNAVQGTGYSEIVYAYNTTTTSTPEPVSMVLLGSGLLGFSLLGRKRLSKFFSR